MPTSKETLTMETTQRTLKAGGRTFFAVEGEAGAVTFAIQSSFLMGYTRLIDGKKMMAADLGVHAAADGPRDNEDFRFMTGCDFTKTKGCRYDGFQSNGNLDLLADEGEAALFAHLTDVYARTFQKES